MREDKEEEQYLKVFEVLAVASTSPIIGASGDIMGASTATLLHPCEVSGIKETVSLEPGPKQSCTAASPGAKFRCRTALHLLNCIT